MRGMDQLRRTLALAILATVVMAGFAVTSFAANVDLTVATTGPAVPGATVTATANVKINDGSTLQSIKWTKVGSLPVTLVNDTTASVTITLPSRAAYRELLVEILEEPPVTAAQLPPHVPAPTEYESGLQNRFTVAAIAPLALEEAGHIVDLTVVTSSGTYKMSNAVPTALPWNTATGNRNVPLNSPVLLHGKTQASYNWQLIAPAGSSATLTGANTQNPEFTPDVTGTYELAVNDTAGNKTTGLSIHAGTWRGMITGQDADGHPIADTACTQCHVKNTPHFDLFTPWAKSGHAEIFTQNVNVAGHYGEGCLSCHTVGYDKAANNGGMDEATNFAAFTESGLLTHGDPLNWSKILTQFPHVAQMSNIQCENCHGPQNSAAHMKRDGSRMTLSSDLCGSCHGEPLRHGRYQQWQLSGHANYVLAGEEGTDPTCGKCHSAQGFLQWADKSFTTANLNVDWTVDEVHPQTCQTCHDPHDVGTTSGGPTTNSKVRVNGTTPLLMSGYTATNVGSGALCMTCHNGRRGLKNDAATWNVNDAARAPHVGPQADILMGQNLYFVPTGTRSNHSLVTDTCVTCHMESSPPPASLANKNQDGSLGGTNHTFYASNEICVKCHTKITAESVQGVVETKMEHLKGAIETALKFAMQNQIRAGNQIELNDGTKTYLLKSPTDLASVTFTESHGNQGLNAKLANGTTTADMAMTAVKVVRPGGAKVNLYSTMDSAVPKAGWNYFSIHSDASKGVHNPTFVNSALDVSLFAVNNVIASASGTNSPMMNPAMIGGGLGNGAGAVSCTTPFVYWAEIAGHMPGNAGSQWRTDVVARNLGTSAANLKFILHQNNGNLEGTGNVAASGQKGFEDIVALLGGTNNLGSLEICSDQPLLVNGRIFNQADSGTFGQNIDGHVADVGYSAGQTVSLIGLRQKSGVWRTNLSFTNSGTTEAQVSVSLFDATGKSLATYPLTIPAGQVLQDTEAFVGHAASPDLDWGFATVTVLKGTNIRTFASLVDMKTNDPTTIAPKQ